MSEHLTMQDIDLIADGESESPAHVRECSRCAGALVDAMQLKRAVRGAMGLESAPASLRRRIHPPQRSSWTLLAAAAAITAIVLGATMLLRPPRPNALGELADMHATLLASPNPVDVISTDKHTVRPWFESKVPFSVPVPDLASTSFRLIGGRVVYWHGNQVAYLLIGKGAHRMSVFVSPQDFGGEPPPNVSALKWQSGGLQFVAIGDVPQSDLAQLRDAFNR
jgi:anti-sigma factor RsiW